mgnify:CR=1 FL=1
MIAEQLIEVDPVDVIERAADGKGRVTIGSDYAGEDVRVAVIEVVDDDDQDDVDPDEIIREYRDERIRLLYRRHEELDQSDLATAFDISRGRVSQILRAGESDAQTAD